MTPGVRKMKEDRIAKLLGWGSRLALIGFLIWAVFKISAK